MHCVPPLVLAQRKAFSLTVQFASDFPTGGTVFEKDIIAQRIGLQDANFTRTDHTGADKRASRKYLRLHPGFCPIVECYLCLYHFSFLFRFATARQSRAYVTRFYGIGQSRCAAAGKQRRDVSQWYN
jgi:hypothetical protein